MYFVYILRTGNGGLYVGVTRDVDKRMKRHRSRDGAEYTKRNRVEKLVHVEEYLTLKEAMKREKQIKGWTRAKKERLIGGRMRGDN